MKKDTALTIRYKNKYQKFSQDELNHYLIEACKVNNMEHVRYLLTSPDLTKHADIHYLGGIAFKWFCRNGYLDGVKYFLHSPELTSHIASYQEISDGFQSAANEGKVEVVDYLLKNTGITQEPSFIEKSQESFFIAASCTTRPSRAILCYLLTYSDLMLVDCEKSTFNLNWAMQKKHDDVVYAMAFSLYRKDVLAYISDYQPQIEAYCLKKGIHYQDWHNAIVCHDMNYVSSEIDLMI